VQLYWRLSVSKPCAGSVDGRRVVENSMFYDGQISESAAQWKRGLETGVMEGLRRV
jgi:hypothetical protein